MGDTYEGEAFDRKAQKKVSVKHDPETGFVIPEEEVFDLNRAEIDEAIRCIQEGLPMMEPGADAPYGEAERFHATIAKAMEFIAFGRWGREQKSFEAACDGEEDPFEHRSIEQMEEDLRLARQDFDYRRDFANRSLMQYRRAMRLRENRIRLGELVEAERRSRNLTQAEFAKLVKVSLSTYQVIEKSDDPNRGMNVKTAANLEQALGWGMGSVQAVLNGGDPVLIRSGAVAGVTQSTGSAAGESSQSSAEASSRFAIRLPDELADELRVQAAKEERTMNRLIESAVRLYLRTMADD